MSASLAPRTGLPGDLQAQGYVLPPDLTYDEWRDVLALVEHIESASPWWVADAMCHGEQAFGQAASDALPTREDDPTGARQSKLKQAAWMAAKYPRNRRVPGLSYTHHRAAAELEPDERQGLLEYAAREHLTTRDLIALVKERQASIKGVVVAAETTCAADQVWSPTVADLTDDARAALTFKAETTAGVRDREAFAAGWLAALHWTEQTDCFSRWGDDDGTEMFGPAADHKAGEGAS